jgi:hypothetical protein
MRHEAIYKLYPNVSTINDDLGVFDVDGNQIDIDEDAVAVEVARLQAERESIEYQRKRAAEYPPMTDYIDGVVKGDQVQIDAYIAACLAVKAKYPKE